MDYPATGPADHRCLIDEFAGHAHRSREGMTFDKLEFRFLPSQE